MVHWNDLMVEASHTRCNGTAVAGEMYMEGVGTKCLCTYRTWIRVALVLWVTIGPLRCVVWDSGVRE